MELLKVVTFYDMNRVRSRRNRILKEIDNIKKDMNSVNGCSFGLIYFRKSRTTICFYL